MQIHAPILLKADQGSDGLAWTCSTPPEGAGRWSLGLLADRMARQSRRPRAA
jgi:hypothetical protein